MDREQRTVDIALRALKLKAAKRKDFVAESCATDAELCAAVERLLEVEGKGREFLERTGRALIGKSQDGDDSPAPKDLSESDTQTSVDILKRIHAVPEVGDEFDDFTILEEIGRGAMGVVFKAHQKSLDRVVAVKMMAGGWIHDNSLKKRFAEEAKVVAKLNHPNIVRVFQVGECSFGHYFAMEYIEGQTLADLLKKGPVDLDWLLTSMIRVIEAIGHAHSHGIIHRDLKPANLMIDPYDRPIVMDFGIAKVEARASTRTLRDLGLGTPAFMAPEQADEKIGEVGARADIYALGAILYTALAGRPPFKESTVVETLLKVVSDERPPFLTSLRPDLPPELERICIVCLEKTPEKRYASAEDLARDLKNLHRSMTSTKKSRVKTARVQVELKEPTTGKLLVISEARTLIGRARSCDIVLDDPEVSKQHCQILVGKKVLVEDLKSSNGTYVNGAKIQRSALENGDELGIAEHRFNVMVRR